MLLDTTEVIFKVGLQCWDCDIEIKCNENSRLSMDDIRIGLSPFAQLWWIDFLIFHGNKNASERINGGFLLVDMDNFLKISIHNVNCQKHSLSGQIKIFL